MPRRQSKNIPICICCHTNRCKDNRQLFCKSCFEFIHHKLEIQSSEVSKKLSLKYYNKIERKCSFCESKAVYTFKNYETRKKYYICQAHQDRWMKIGCELGELSNFLHVDE